MVLEEEMRLLDKLKAQLDQEAFATAARMEEDRTKSKYLDIDHWFPTMWRDVKDNNLHRSSPLEILDIGTGPGFFPLMCREFGHICMGLDKPGRSSTFYKALRRAVGTEAIDHRIRPFIELPRLNARYDLVTAFRTTFNIIRNEKRLWNLDEWAFFLDDLRDNVLKPNGRFFFRMNEGYRYPGLVYGTPELMDAFEARGAVFKERRGISFEPLR